MYGIWAAIRVADGRTSIFQQYIFYGSHKSVIERNEQAVLVVYLYYLHLRDVICDALCPLLEGN